MGLKGRRSFPLNVRFKTFGRGLEADILKSHTPNDHQRAWAACLLADRAKRQLFDESWQLGFKGNGSLGRAAAGVSTGDCPRAA